MLSAIKEMINSKKAIQEATDIIFEDLTQSNLDDAIILGEESEDPEVAAPETGETPEPEKDEPAEEPEAEEPAAEDNGPSLDNEPVDGSSPETPSEDTLDTPIDPTPAAGDDNAAGGDETLPLPGDDSDLPSASGNDEDALLSTEIDIGSNTVKDVLPVPPASAPEAIAGDGDDIMGSTVDSGFDPEPAGDGVGTSPSEMDDVLDAPISDPTPAAGIEPTPAPVEEPAEPAVEPEAPAAEPETEPENPEAPAPEGEDTTDMESVEFSALLEATKDPAVVKKQIANFEQQIKDLDKKNIDDKKKEWARKKLEENIAGCKKHLKSIEESSDFFVDGDDVGYTSTKSSFEEASFVDGDDVISTNVPMSEAITLGQDPSGAAPTPAAAPAASTDPTTDPSAAAPAAAPAADPAAPAPTDPSAEAPAADGGVDPTGEPNPEESPVTTAVKDKVAEMDADTSGEGPTDGANKEDLLKKLGNITKSLEDAKKAVMNSIPS